jgi:hypothetical protein
MPKHQHSNNSGSYLGNERQRGVVNLRRCLKNTDEQTRYKTENQNRGARVQSCLYANLSKS